MSPAAPPQLKWVVGIGALIALLLGVLVIQLKRPDPLPSKQPKAGSQADRGPNGPSFEWSFPEAVEEGWTALATVEPSRSGLRVTTGKDSGYQLYSENLLLPAGRYELEADIQLFSGGLALGVLDLGMNDFVVSFGYIKGELGSNTPSVSRSFRLPRSTAGSVVLSNAAPGKTSTWEVNEISLARVSPDG